MLPVPREYRAQPIRIKDGDTIIVLADTGFFGREEVDLRLLDVAAPELNEPGGPEARTFIESWLARRNPALRWPLLVRTEMTKVYEPTQQMTFARFVGEVFDIETAASLNAAIRDHLAT